MAGRVDEWERGGGITALMGPSGAGKTTLLNVLARRSTSHSRMEGDVRVNGHALTDSEMKSISGYVTQHDGEHLWVVPTLVENMACLSLSSIEHHRQPGLPAHSLLDLPTHRLPLLPLLQCCPER